MKNTSGFKSACLCLALAGCGSSAHTGGTAGGTGATSNGGTGQGAGGTSQSAGGTSSSSGGSAGAATGGASASGGDANGGNANGGNANGGNANGTAGVGNANGGGAGTPPVNPNPTISSFLGTNVAADLPRVDIAYQLNAFDTDKASLDANGYPVAGASGTSTTDLGFILPTGQYKISFKGNGAVSVSGIAKLNGTWTTAGGEQRAAVDITGTPGNFGGLITIKIQNGPGQSVSDLHLYYPGVGYDSSVTFLPEFLRILTPFRALRFMDWEATNNSTLTDWATRPAAAHFGHSGFGEPYEHIAELVNETGKDCWVTIPEHASPDFIAQFATFLAAQLDFSRIDAARAKAGFTTPFQLLLENSNETWNGGFSAKATFLAAANQDTTKYDGKFTGTHQPTWMSGDSDLMKVAQYEADRLVQAARVFRAAFDAKGQASAIAPVLSGWALGAAYSEEGLLFIKANYGDPKKYVSYVAQAPYFGADDKDTGSLSALFTALQANIASMDATYLDFKALGAEYGVGIVAYEGGQGLSGTANQPIKHLAQHDARMYDAYKAYLALWTKDFGKNSLFMHFSLAGDPGIPEMIYQYGYWGSIIGALEDPAKCEPNLPMLVGTEAFDAVAHHCPKYRALAEQVP